MKSTLLTVLVLSFALSAAAQKGVEFGLKAGVNAANFKLGNGDGEALIGFHAGALAHIHLDKHFALQPELLYSGQGSKYTDARKDRFNYLNLPVLLQFMFGQGFRLQTGPQLGFLLSAKNEVNDTDFDIDENFKKTDVSWSFGAGYLSPIRLGIDFRYNLGLTQINKQQPDTKNRVWQFGLFYQFGR